MTRAPDKGAEPADLDGQFAFLAERAKPRLFDDVAVRIMVWEDVCREGLIEGVQNMGDPQVLGLADGF